MKLLRSTITLYDEVFKNDCADTIIQKLNAKENMAFDLISETIVKELDDTTLDRKLFITLYDKTGDREAYKSFKRKLKTKLRRIASLAVSKGSQRQKEEFQLLDSYSSIYKMIYMGLRDPAIKEAELLLSKSIKRLNYRIARDTCWLLVHHHCQFELEKDLKEKYHAQYKELNALCEIEYQAQIIYGEALKTVKYSTITARRQEGFIMKMDELGKVLDRESYLYHVFFFKIHLLFSEGETYKDWCLEAIDYYSNLWYDHTHYVSLFRNHLLDYYLSIHEYARAELNLLTLLDDSKRYSYPWYRYAITLVKTYLRINDFEKADIWHRRLINSRKFRTLEKSHRNHLLILGMYVKIGLGKSKEVKLHRARYNVIYQKHPIDEEVVNFLAAEIICLIKNGKLDVESKLKTLRKLAYDDVRCISFCDTIEFGTKYRVEESSSFEKEIIEYERLVRMI